MAAMPPLSSFGLTWGLDPCALHFNQIKANLVRVKNYIYHQRKKEKKTQLFLKINFTWKGCSRQFYSHFHSQTQEDLEDVTQMGHHCQWYYR